MKSDMLTHKKTRKAVVPRSLVESPAIIADELISAVHNALYPFTGLVWAIKTELPCIQKLLYLFICEVLKHLFLQSKRPPKRPNALRCFLIELTPLYLQLLDSFSSLLSRPVAQVRRLFLAELAVHREDSVLLLGCDGAF